MSRAWHTLARWGLVLSLCLAVPAPHSGMVSAAGGNPTPARANGAASEVAAASDAAVVSGVSTAYGPVLTSAASTAPTAPGASQKPSASAPAASAAALAGAGTSGATAASAASGTAPGSAVAGASGASATAATATAAVLAAPATGKGKPSLLNADTQACPTVDTARARTGACMPANDPLTLQKTTVPTLPSAVVNQPYLYRFQASGGQPPYTFAEIGHDLPDGITLAPDGSVAGTAGQRGRKTFTLELRDQSGQALRQRFVLNVIEPRASQKPSVKPASAPAALTPIETLPVAAAQTPLAQRGLITTYVLTDDVLKLIHPAAAEAAPATDAASGVQAGAVTVVNAAPATAAVPQPQQPQAAAGSEGDALDALDDAGATQLAALLEPLIGVEYPTRALFAAALDARVCTYAAALTDRAAVDGKQASPTAEQWRQRCAVAWQGSPSSNPATLPATAQVKWQDLPVTLLPVRVRTWLIDEARQERDAEAGSALGWSGTGCNCLVGPSSGQVIGVVPNWSDPQKGPKIDFSLYDRLLMFAQPFDDDGNVTPLQPQESQIEFFRAARRFGTKIDLTIYRKDWQFLQRLPADHQPRIAAQIAKQAVQMIDTPLESFGQRWQDRVPGLTGDKHLGHGLTVYLDNLPAPGDSGYAVFDAFRRQLLSALIAELRRGGRPYTLNLMINGRDLIPALREGSPIGPVKDRSAAPKQTSWTIERLFDLMVEAEAPHFEGGRISSNANGYRSNTNVTLNYVVLLPEPSKINKKVLRETIESVETTPELLGTNRAIFLRRVLPLVSVGSATPKQFADDMAYFNDNFGGVVLWPQPEADAELTSMVEKTVRSTLLVGEPTESSLCNLVCDWRWLLRFVFGLLLGNALLSLLLYLTSCRIRALGRPYQLYLLLAGIVPLVIGGLLLRCDPDIANTGLSRQLLVGVLVAVILSLLFPLLKPKAEKP
ncbi:Ig domain-containing protein [Ralstonia sp. ASV6]|nr:putative Ig domain-containing protein [Ralstonia sp. ASV6]